MEVINKIKHLLDFISHKEDETHTHNTDTLAAGSTAAIAAGITPTVTKPKTTISKATKQDLYKQAADSYAKKLKMEKPLYSNMTSFFDKINKYFKAQYAKTGIIPSISDYQKELEKTLNEHGIKVGNTFSNGIRDRLGNPPNNATIQRKLEANIKGMAAQRSHLISHSILDTTRDNLDKAVKDAHVSLALEDTEITNNNVAKVASDKLTTQFLGRSNIIAITETQFAAEGGKDTEFSTLDDFDVEYDGEPISEIIKQKMWVAILDDHTREAHAEADGQTVNIDDPFEVGGEQLMYPGDDSMGASESNLINCRCSQEYDIGD